MLKKYRRIIASLLLVTILSNIFAPTISLALTAGPTAPEATSFEPVDTTDMVNLATGDLAYNIPLLEVPGPAGGYPLSLSYHAGIMPNEEASWVGLGWTLNPGAITRNVNGFADDHKQAPNSTRYFWEGGETKTYTVGVTIGVPGTPASLSAGLAFSQDTYQGSGVGAYLGGRGGIEGTPFGVDATIGVSPYGGSYASAGVDVSVGGSSTKGFGLSAGTSVSTNFNTVHTSVNAGLNLAGAIGASIQSGSKGVTTNVSVAGASFVSNSNSGRVSSYSTRSSAFVPILPGKLSLTVGYEYHRYWIDEMDNVTVNGALYNHVDLANTYEYGHFDGIAFDTYSLLDPELPGGIVDNPDPEKVMGGSFPGYDNYSVHAQGLYGDMRPYQFHRHLKNRNSHNKNSGGEKVYQTVQYYLGSNDMVPEFRFINDFSNRFEYDPGTIQHSANNDTPLTFDFAGSVTKGETGTESYTTDRLAGSRHIEWLTNSDIINKTTKYNESKFIDTRSTGFTREGKSGDLIGGFVITNESGVKYHFALPAYSYDEYFYSENKTGPETYNEYGRPEPYAYTWYLTAITGPDYVDRSAAGTANGILDQYDWGYWVEFEYGKWTEVYQWRNPSEGMMSDLDTDFQNFSHGLKELYYLDAIRTKTHTALFFKDIRHDAKSNLHFFKSIRDGNKFLSPNVKTGGFLPETAFCACSSLRVQGSPPVPVGDYGIIEYTAVPTSSLKLSSVVLIDNNSLAQVSLQKTGGAAFEQDRTYNWEVYQDVSPPDRPQCDFSPVTVNHHLYENVYDINDLNAEIEGEALRIIEFDTDYSLSPETANSFDISAGEKVLMGKLTLSKLKFFGKARADLIPPMVFDYDLDDSVTGEAAMSIVSPIPGNLKVGSFVKSNSGLVVGDIITFFSNQKQYYGVILKIDAATNIHVFKVLGKNTPASGYYKYGTTKNPPYDKDAYDVWGMYKSDYWPVGNSYAARMVSRVSARGKDAWCLRRILSPTGAEISVDYESDTYRKPASYNSNLLRIKSVSPVPGTNRYKIVLYDNISNLDQTINNASVISYLMNFASPKDWQNSPYDGDCPEIGQGTGEMTFVSDIYEGEMTVHSIYEEQNLWVIETITDLSSFFARKPEVFEPESCYYYLEEYHDPIFIAGNISHSNESRNLGGDLRVKSVQIKNLFKSSRTFYSYETTGMTYGVTAYEPNGLEQVSFHYPNGHQHFESDEEIDAAKDDYRKKLYSNFTKLLMNARELPSPGVIYQYVRVGESVLVNAVEETLPNETLYEFEVFKDGMVGIESLHTTLESFAQKSFPTTDQVPPSVPFRRVPYDRKETRNVVLKDYTSRLGALKKITLYSGSTKISETLNHYLHDGIVTELLSTGSITDELQFAANKKVYESRLASADYNSQGVIEESFSYARFVRREDDRFSLLGVVSKREQFPVIQTGQTTTNFKTGITTSSTNLRFDFYSGQVTKSKTVDGYGNTFVTEITPAYKQYNAMGLLSNGGKNMLTQQAAAYTYKIDPTDNNRITGLVGASVQTWSDQVSVLGVGAQPGIWRKHASYSFVGDNNVAVEKDGLYPLNNSLPQFNAWSSGAVPAGWQRDASINLYDFYSHALEASDVNEQFAATKMSSDQTQVLTTASDARYDQFAYSGAEDNAISGIYGGGVRRENGIEESAAHTGDRSLKLTGSGQKAFLYSLTIEPERAYRASVWVNASGGRIYYKIGSAAPVSCDAPSDLRKAGGWYLLTLDIPASQASSTLEVWCGTENGTCHFDDFRVHPVGAVMTSYVYNNWGELTHILDYNNIFTQYEYDGMGRLYKTYRETFKNEIVNTSVVTYHYSDKIK